MCSGIGSALVIVTREAINIIAKNSAKVNPQAVDQSMISQMDTKKPIILVTIKPELNGAYFNGVAILTPLYPLY